jgi:transposase
MRTTLGCTITTAARQLGQWPSKISLLERGLIRDDDLATTYRQWLTEQKTGSTKLSQQTAGSGWHG